MDDEFTEYVRGRSSALLRTAVFLSAGDRHAAEDLLQTALERVYLAWRRIRNPGARDAYVRTTMVRLAIRRRRFFWTAIEEPYSDYMVGALSDGTDDVMARLDLWAYLSKLSDRQRAVVVLRYYEDLSEEQIAATLGCSPGTVKSHAARALRALRDQTGEHDSFPEPLLRGES